jgi:DNA polymerase
MPMTTKHTIFLDFETFYDKGYSLKSPKVSMSEYIRDERFLVHCVGWAVDNNPVQWCDRANAEHVLRTLPWDDATLVCHNTAFDGLILSHHYGIVPKRYADTMLMSRAVFGGHVEHNLDALTARLNIGGKLEGALENTKGMRELPPEILGPLGEYCANDVAIMAECHDVLVKKIPKNELELMHITLRMFCDPILEVDMDRVKAALDAEMGKKVSKILLTGTTKDQLSSNDKFVELLEQNGVTVPTKRNAKGMPVAALAKKDTGFLHLYQTAPQKVKDIIDARLAIKSTIGETRARRFLEAGRDGMKLPVLLQYCGAHTTRWSAGNRMNFQNLPRGGELRKSILAPFGHVLVVIDSAQIEARLNLWMAGDEDKLQIFRNYDAGTGPDLYRVMASQIYNKRIEDVTKDERQLGKVCVLALGYGMGADKLRATLATDPVNPIKLSMEQACRIVDIYREFNVHIVKLWRELEELAGHMYAGDHWPYKAVVFEKHRIDLPSGLSLHYTGMTAAQSEMTKRFYNIQYKSLKGQVQLYGGILCENIVQALARCVIAEQMLEISKRYRIATMTHDEVVFIAPEAEGQAALDFGLKIMRTPPKWAPDLPLNAEGDYARHYCK